MTKFYNAQHLFDTIAPAPRLRLRLRLREVLSNPRKYFRVNCDEDWFCDPDHSMQPGPGLIGTIEKATNRKIRADYDAALAPLSAMPRQVWELKKQGWHLLHPIENQEPYFAHHPAFGLACDVQDWYAAN